MKTPLTSGQKLYFVYQSDWVFLGQIFYLDCAPTALDADFDRVIQNQHPATQLLVCHPDLIWLPVLWAQAILLGLFKWYPFCYCLLHLLKWTWISNFAIIAMLSSTALHYQHILCYKCWGLLIQNTELSFMSKRWKEKISKLTQLYCQVKAWFYSRKEPTPL